MKKYKPSLPGHFGSMFPAKPFDPPGRTDADKRRWLAERAASMEGDSSDNPRIPAGYTYFGQLVSHDLSFDSTPVPHDKKLDRDLLQNQRSPWLELDSVYGGGPDVDPDLYEDTDTGKLRVGRAHRAPDTKAEVGEELDLPRFDTLAVPARVYDKRVRKDKRVAGGVGVHPDSTLEVLGRRYYRVDDLRSIRLENDTHYDIDLESDAVMVGTRARLGDPRDDQTVLIAQMHLVMLRLHNKLLEAALDEGKRGREAFEQARRETTWRYQWVLVEDYLRRLTTDADLEQCRKRHAQTQGWMQTAVQQPVVPIEFAAAAFRMGHSMVRSAYHLNHDSGRVWLFKDAYERTGMTWTVDLRGGRKLPQRWSIQWDYFLPFGEPAPHMQYSRRIGPRTVPAMAWFPDDESARMAERTLVRGWRLGLPSGQDVARLCGREPIAEEPMPLFEYVLAEAALQGDDGERLGPVGSHIVLETILGLLATSPSSYIRATPAWMPPGGKGYDLSALVQESGAPIRWQDLPFAAPDDGGPPRLL